MKRAMRFASRLVLAGAALAVVAMVAIQYERIIVRNLALGHALGATRAEVSALKTKERKQKRVIERLSDPRGAIPEIHERLHAVSPHEELIYLKTLPTPAARPKDPEGP